MSKQNSISYWISGAKDGDPQALQAVWEVYYPKLVRLARERLIGGNRRAADEEDIAISVFESFFRAAAEQRFPDLRDRDQLWRLLLSMTSRKVIDHQRKHLRARRGNGQVRGESALDLHDNQNGIAQVIGESPSPEFAAALCEEASLLLESLEDPELQQIACAKLEGFENTEIALQLNCSLSTVERRLRLIRKKWSHHLETDATES